MQGVAYEERGLFRFDPMFHPKDDIDVEAYDKYIEQDKKTPVEVEQNGA